MHTSTKKKLCRKHRTIQLDSAADHENERIYRLKSVMFVSLLKYNDNEVV